MSSHVIDRLNKGLKRGRVRNTISTLILSSLLVINVIIVIWGSNLQTAQQNTISSIGIIATLIISFLASAISFYNVKSTIYNSNKTNYINSVTAARVHYIDKAKELLSRYCGLCKSFALTGWATPVTKNQVLFQEIDSLRYLICFQLNYKDRFDQLIMHKLEFIANLANPDTKSMNQQESELNHLTELVQAWLKCEWEGVKLEGENGILDRKTKVALWDEYLLEHVTEFDRLHPGTLKSYAGYR